MVKNPNWHEADQLGIYEHGRGVELGATEKQLQLPGLPDFKSAPLGHAASLPNHSSVFSCVSCRKIKFNVLFTVNIFIHLRLLVPFSGLILVRNTSLMDIKNFALTLHKTERYGVHVFKTVNLH